MPDLSKYRKAVTAVVGAVLILAAAFAPGKYDEWIQVAIGLLTAIGVYEVPNAEPAGE